MNSTILDGEISMRLSALPARMVLGHSLRRAAGPMKTTVVRAATALAPALALWLASAEAPTRVYAQG